MKKQKFRRGDLVHVAADLGPSMSHFTCDVDAVVLGTYAELCRHDVNDGRLYKNRDIIQYSLYLKGGGSSSWYKEDQLTLLKRGRWPLLQRWVRKDERGRARELAAARRRFKKERDSKT